MKELIAKLEAKKAEARQALEAGDLEKGRSLKAECEAIRSAVEELKALDAITVVAPEPVRPPVPGAGLNTIPETRTNVDVDERDDAGSILKSVYVKRFGEPDTLIRSWLAELHGSDYVGRWYSQQVAFQRYLRGGEAALRKEDRDAMKTVVFTPRAVQAAWDQGVWDVSVLKSTMVEASDELGGYANWH